MTGPVAASEDYLGDLEELARFSEGTDLEQSDPLTKFFLGAATEAVRNYCGWHVFPVREETLILDGPGGHLLVLPTGKLLDVVSITELGETVTDFEWSADGKLRKRCWTERYRAISITVRHGHSSAQDLLSTIYAIASRAASSPSGAIQDTAGPFTLVHAQISSGVAGGLGMLAHEQAILDRYALADEA